MPVELAIQQAVLTERGPYLFMLHVPASFSPEAVTRLRATWAQAWSATGASKMPALLILPEGFSLATLSGAQLREAGLMRVPDARWDVSAFDEAVWA